eukprot:4307732-Pleurochrysis_carterae.AAC.2
MAVCMTAAWGAKHENELPGYSNWAVSFDNLMQWLGICTLAAFSLPTYCNTSVHTDKSFLMRKFWDALRDASNKVIVCLWLMMLDESVGRRWMGRGMPGPMVMQRKPTPVGLELHTLCCALCGVLRLFDVYEGKDAMAKKAYNNLYPKSTTLTMR